MEQAGFTAEDTAQTYTDFYKILGDQDTATEATQLLSKLATSQEDLSKWTTISTGVVGAFGDSLPIESLIEAANETAKVGTVTGTLADALNWAGVSEDEFNEKLATMTTEQERNAYITETLNGLYAESAEAYAENNKEILQANENQARMDEIMATVGETVLKLKNAFTEELMPVFQPLIEEGTAWLESLDIDAVVDNVMGLIETFTALLPVIVGVTTASVAFYVAINQGAIVSAVTNALTAMKTAVLAVNAAMAANPVGLVIAILAGLVTALITAYQTSDVFREKVDAAFAAVKTVVTDVIDWVNGKLSAFTGIGKNMIEGIWEGITSMSSWISDKVTGFVDGIKEIFTGSDGFDTHSPSKWSQEVFKNVLLGGEIGLEDGSSELYSTVDGVVSGVKDGFSTDMSADVSSYGTSGQSMEDLVQMLATAVTTGLVFGLEEIRSTIETMLDREFIFQIDNKEFARFIVQEGDLEEEVERVGKNWFTVSEIAELVRRYAPTPSA